jgi:hypothetical protein
MALSHNPDLWQSLEAEKQNELENSPEFIAIEKELEDLPLESRNRRNELRAQKRKLVSEELRKCQRFQQRRLSSKADKGDKRVMMGPSPRSISLHPRSDARTRPLGV